MEKNKLREVIYAEGITPADLAKGTGIAPASIARYMKGGKPKEPYISKIVIAINKMALKKMYERNDIFPN